MCWLMKSESRFGQECLFPRLLSKHLRRSNKQVLPITEDICNWQGIMMTERGKDSRMPKKTKKKHQTSWSMWEKFLSSSPQSLKCWPEAINLYKRDYLRRKPGITDGFLQRPPLQGRSAMMKADLTFNTPQIIFTSRPDDKDDDDGLQPVKFTHHLPSIETH